MKTLAGKVVAITGAGRGIGRAVALLAAREGASVVVNDMGVEADGSGGSRGPAADVVAEIVAEGGDAIANFADVSDPAQAQALVDDALRAWGRLDAVVNNAGILRNRAFEAMTAADWDDVIRVNLNGCYYVSRAAAECFLAQGSGAFVHYTSTSGLIGNMNQANYASAKLGTVGLSHAIALELGERGVTSNCIAPYAWSRLAPPLPTDTVKARERAERLKTMTAERIAPLAVFLCSEAGKAVNGQIFCARQNEIFLFSPPRPIRSMHRADGWTVEAIAQHLLPAFRPDFSRVARAGEIFSWDPI